MAQKSRSTSAAPPSSATPKAVAPTASNETAREVNMRELLTNPRFREALCRGAIGDSHLLPSPHVGGGQDES
jgi:hypothetical protein